MLYTTFAVSCLLTSTLAIPSYRELKHRHLHDTSANAHPPHYLPSGTAGSPYGIANATTGIYTGTAGPTATGAIIGSGSGTVQTVKALATETVGLANALGDTQTPSTGTEAEAANSNTGSDSSSDSGTDTEAANADTGKTGSGSGTDSDSAEGANCGAATVTVTASPTVTVTVQAGAAAAATTSGTGTHGSAESPTEEPDSVSSPTTPSASPSSAAGSGASGSGSTGSTGSGSSGSSGSGSTGSSGSGSSGSGSSSGSVLTSSAAGAASSIAPTTGNAGNIPVSSAAGATGSTAPTTGGGDTPSGGTAVGLKSKRGIIASGSNMDGLAKAFGNTKVSWLGNWFSAPPPDLPASMTFVPQMYGKGSDDNGEWTKNAQKAVQEGDKYMLSFGEPGTPNPTRYMDPAAGAAYWMQYMEPYAKQGVKIGAPGTLQNTQDFDWLSKFLDACTECTISFIAMHWFDKAGAAQVPGFKDTLNKAKTLAGNKPIWLDNFSAAGSAADQKEFLGEVVPWLEQQENIQAYAYCPPDVATAGAGGGMLDGDSLNDLGQYYANL